MPGDRSAIVPGLLQRANREGVAQIVVQVLSAGEVAGMVVTFAVLTVVAGGLLAWRLS